MGERKTIYRQLTNEERHELQLRGCSAEEWDSVYVAEDFATSQLRSVHFEGRVTIGSRCRIVDSTIRNYTIGNDCTIEAVSRMECRHTSTFGEGIEVAVINENGGRKVTIYRDLTAQTAYLMAMMRHRREAVAELQRLVAEHIANSSSEIGTVGNNVTIRCVKFLREVSIEDDVTIEGASQLRNGTICRGAEVGVDVRACDFIFAEEARVEDGASIERCFIGERSIVANNFTAVDTLLFANCHCENGEAVSVFAGPCTVSHHKSSLLIAGIFSFFNAGSGTNQSNHLFKSGAVHQAVHERGTKFGSNGYIMAPSIEGPYTVVMGRHTRHHDTQDMPYSYLIESEGKTMLLPAIALTSYGAVRDIEKWKVRDRRRLKRDNIRYEEFNPFITGRMLRGVDTLTRLQEDDPEAKTYSYNRTTIKASMLQRGIKLYNSAIAASLGIMLGAGDHRMGKCDNTEWIDLAGEYVPLGIVNELLTRLETGDITLEEIQETFDDVMHNYNNMAAAYAYDILARLTGHQPSDEEVDETIAAAGNIVARMREATDADRRRDSSEEMWVGYGYDFRGDEEREADFRNTR
ncbi:MAG: DUF4954 family protein [Alistipes sp.]|nr:DUF4954 family protein [Alistipes sp.]